MNIIDKDNLFLGFRPENLEPEQIFKHSKDSPSNLNYM